MYHNILDDFKKLVSPERIIIYKDSISLLLQKDTEMFDIMLDNFKSSMYEAETSSNIHDFDEFLIGNLRGVIEEFSVYLQMDMVTASSLEPLTALAKTLYNYDRYDNQHELLAMVNADVPAIELISELVASITEYQDTETIMGLIESVSPNLIKRMRTISQETIALEEEVSVDSPETIARIALIAQLCNEWEINGPYELLSHGYKLGRDTQVYGEMLITVNDIKDSLRITRLAVLSALMTNKPLSEVRLEASEYLQLRLDETPDILIQAGRHLGKIELED